MQQTVAEGALRASTHSIQKNFIFMPGGQVARYHSMRDGRHGRREPDMSEHSQSPRFCREKVWPLRMHLWPQPIK